MNVLAVFSDLSYPPREGLHQQSVLLLQQLIKSGADVRVMTISRKPDHLNTQQFEADCHAKLYVPPEVDSLPSVMRGLTNLAPYPLQSKRMRAFQKSLNDLAVNWADAVYLEGAAAAGFARQKFASKTIVNIVDPPSLRQIRMLSRAHNRPLTQTKYLTSYILSQILESATNRNVRQWNTVSPQDATWLRENRGFDNVSSISVMLPEEVFSDRSRNDRQDYFHGVVFADLRQSYLRNAFLQFVEQVRLQNSLTKVDIRISVLGRVEADEELSDACAGLRVNFLPYVDDYLNFLADSDLIILPDLFGTGLKNRAIQSMAIGRGVLATDVAMEGIPAINGVHADIVDGAENLARRLSVLVLDKPYCDRLGAEGRKLASATYEPRMVTDKWLSAFTALSTPRDWVDHNHA